MQFRNTATLSMLLGLAGACARPEEEAATEPESTVEQASSYADATRTVTTVGAIDRANPFFQSLGTNGRTCETCHLQDQGWTIVPRRLRERFDATGGTDPIFRPHDGANAPLLDVSTESARRSAYSLLLSRGVIRVGLPVKPTSEFELAAVDDPYGHASATQLSLFRRPLPTTNLRFASTVNWDGRNTPDLTNMRPGLLNQANGATVNHAQASAPIAPEVRAPIVDFETGIATAQTRHPFVGALDVFGAKGGPNALAAEPFTLGGDNTQGFDLFAAWSGRRSCFIDAIRDTIAQGERVFNAKCSGCHSTHNVGSSATFRFFDVKVSAASRRASEVPLYTFRNKTTGEEIQTTDPGRALITGAWSDMNRFKVPALRGLAARAPYFHDGSARTLWDVVDHYVDNVGIDIRDHERFPLVMFLESL